MEVLASNQWIRFPCKINIKVGLSPYKEVSFIWFNKSSSKMIINAIYLILKARFVLKYLKFCPYFFGHLGKRFIRMLGLISKFFTPSNDVWHPFSRKPVSLKEFSCIYWYDKGTMSIQMKFCIAILLTQFSWHFFGFEIHSIFFFCLFILDLLYVLFLSMSKETTCTLQVQNWYHFFSPHIFLL